jgi:hypothetical protein
MEAIRQLTDDGVIRADGSPRTLTLDHGDAFDLYRLSTMKARSTVPGVAAVNDSISPAPFAALAAGRAPFAKADQLPKDRWEIAEHRQTDEERPSALTETAEERAKIATAVLERRPKPTPYELFIYRFLRESTSYLMEMVNRLDEHRPAGDKLDREPFREWLEAHDFESRVSLWTEYKPQRGKGSAPLWLSCLDQVWSLWLIEHEADE